MIMRNEQAYIAIWKLAAVEPRFAIANAIDIFRNIHGVEPDYIVCTHALKRFLPSDINDIPIQSADIRGPVVAILINEERDIKMKI